jgi:hypothetical protein
LTERSEVIIGLRKPMRERSERIGAKPLFAERGGA